MRPAGLPRGGRLSLCARVLLAVLTVLLVSHAFSFAWMLGERSRMVRGALQSVVAPDAAGAVALLDRLAPGERAGWLATLARPGYRYRAGQPPAGVPELSAEARWVGSALAAALGAARVGPATRPAAAAPGRTGSFHIGLLLVDGTPYTLELDREPWPARGPGWPWPVALGLGLMLFAALAHGAVRWALWPLARLVRLARSLDPRQQPPPWPETGPRETACLARAVNTLRSRMACQAAGRRHVMAAVSRELQRPLTRLGLRVALLQPDALRQALQADLAQAQAGLAVGMGYVQAVGVPGEAACPTELHSLLDGLACDYLDDGRPVRLVEPDGAVLCLRPLLLRRVLTHLIDGALHFPGEVELRICRDDTLGVLLSVLDRGPAIDESGIGAARLLCGRLDCMPGIAAPATRLGLLVVPSLADELGARLSLRNRPGGGLEAHLGFPEGGMPWPQGRQAALTPE